MKQITKILLPAIIMIAFSASTFAQTTATATANATIITPLTLAKTADLNFGNLYVSPTVAGTVVIDPDDTRSQTGGVTLATGGTVGAAVFTVSGLIGATYSITLPASHTISSGGNNMTVDNFNSTPTVAAGGNLGVGGTETLRIGAILNVNAGQAVGIYSSGTPFDVTVNYN